MTAPDTVTKRLAEVLCNEQHPDLKIEAVPLAIDPRHRVAACYGCQLGAAVLAPVVDELVAEAKVAALCEAADDVSHEVRKFEPSCEADLGYYDAHMEVVKMLRDKADREGARR